MRKLTFTFFILFTLLMLLSQLSFANNPRHYQQRIAKGIDHILASSPENVNVGMVIANMHHNHIIYTRNPYRYFTPASNLKLFTTSAALLYLGADYRYNTTIVAQKKQIHHHVINGNVYLKFSGDPTFTSANLATMIRELKYHGIDEINGNFYLVNDVYGHKQYASGWMLSDLNTCYSAPLDGIILNHNCVHGYLTPNRHIDHRAHLHVNYPASFLDFINHVNTANYAARCSLHTKITAQNHYLLRGCIAPNIEQKNLDFAIKNIPLYAKDYVKTFLQQNNIKLTGKITLHPLPNDKKFIVLVKHHSPTMRAIVVHTLKYSDDLYADSLLKALGHVYFKTQGTWQNGVAAMETILHRRIGLDFKHANIVDGSGVSRYDMVSPQLIARLLTFDYHHFPVSAELMSALPISGVDGTLADRMTSSAMRGQVRAKTGTMTGVSALSGYLITKRHHHLMFVIIMNNFTGQVATYRRLQDRICRFLVLHG